MSSMFRSMLSSLSVYPKFSEQEGPTIEGSDSDDDSELFVECPTSNFELPKDVSIEESESTSTSTKEPAIISDSVTATESTIVTTMASAVTSAKTKEKSAKQNFGKKSRKKLSAMMGKIQSTMQQNGKSSAAKKAAMSNGAVASNITSITTNGIGVISEKNYGNATTNGNGHLLHKLAQVEGTTNVKCNSTGDDLLASEKISLQDYEDDGKAAFVLPEEQCDIPTFLNTKNCDRHLIDETRRLLRERYLKNPDSFYDEDYKRMLNDDWTVSRFLLRRRLDPKRTAKLMEECGIFRKQYKMSEVELWEFPIEFHKAGGLFKYAPDRVGNMTLYMRVKMYRRVPEISDVFKAWILCILEECDRENNGRGTAVIFDLSGCGLQNVDLGFLSWLLSSFRNYCPKGVSYILVYNLPWILNATCKLAMTWMSASNRRALRFVHGDEIENFIAPENLPDYCGGTCKLNYKAIPEGALPATEVCGRLDMTRDQALKIREMFKDYLEDNDDKSSAQQMIIRMQ